MDKKGRLIVVTGPSGVGKTTLIKKLINNNKDKIIFSISFTSRLARRNEVNGIDYYFISKKEFEKGIQNKRFLEYALVHDNYYGTDKNQVENILLSGKDCLLDIDVQGGLNIMSNKIKALFVFIAPLSIDVLKKRLLNRSTDSIEIIEKRIKNAEKELKEKEKYQYIIINDNIDRAYNELESILFNN